jgi:hypothetical protein
VDALLSAHSSKSKCEVFGVPVSIDLACCYTPKTQPTTCLRKRKPPPNPSPSPNPSPNGSRIPVRCPRNIWGPATGTCSGPATRFSIDGSDLRKRRGSVWHVKLHVMTEGNDEGVDVRCAKGGSLFFCLLVPVRGMHRACPPKRTNCRFAGTSWTKLEVVQISASTRPLSRYATVLRWHRSRTIVFAIDVRLPDIKTRQQWHTAEIHSSLPFPEHPIVGSTVATGVIGSATMPSFRGRPKNVGTKRLGALLLTVRLDGCNIAHSASPKLSPHSGCFATTAVVWDRTSRNIKIVDDTIVAIAYALLLYDLQWSRQGDGSFAVPSRLALSRGGCCCSSW